MPQPRQLISIIVPCYNEAQNINPFHQALSKVLSSRREQFEIIFIDDGSKDDTVSGLHKLASIDPRIRVIELVRNFRKEVAITAGLHASRGAAAICIDADLQHPPSLIPDLLEKWHHGAEVVIGVRTAGSKHTSFIKRAGSAVFYRLMNAMSQVEIVPRATDYRLIDRAVINEFNRFTERNRMTRGLIDWLGFRRAYVEFDTPTRNAGDAGYSLMGLTSLAINTFVSMSLVPLKLAGWLGAVIILISAPLGAFVFIEKYLLHDPMGLGITGSATLGVILLFMVGLILMCLGLMALYIATIHTEVMNRPLYVARREDNRRALVEDQDMVEEHREEAEEAMRA